METLADLVAAARDREGPFLAPPARATAYSYPEFCTGVWKAGNLLRHYGVHPGATLTVVVGPNDPAADDTPGRLGDAADPLLALMGGTLVGAAVCLGPDLPNEARALVAPGAWIDSVAAPASCTRIAYGGPPAATDVVHFERERWSENPVAPPETVAPDTVALVCPAGRYPHGSLLEAAETTVREHDLQPGARLGLDAPLESAGAIVTGVLAPLLAGATVVPLRGESDRDDAELDVLVSGDSAAGLRTIDPAAVSIAPDTRRA